ncbi:RING-type domain-containing protein [Caenorhabditis elegans]|uniref:RING-type domain-containing protein n=1 Tax=Caenorhabditis elegans TaxID=6239 RepID=O62463_CAEEL|nr:RING-type domain-containing protein [Caenorhabditis elegans]CAA16350.1 RING-type domain-containing protein [Caenorhabditis elegans]|eukprot:NP_502624.1 Uncharacterized protein CELE_Y45F10B.9 [Caenorhabditis elegans]
MKSLKFMENFISTVPFNMWQNMAKLKRELEDHIDMPEQKAEKFFENLQLDIMIMAAEKDIATDEVDSVKQALMNQQMITQHLKKRNEYLDDLEEANERIKILDEELDKLEAKISKTEESLVQSVSMLLEKDEQLKTIRKEMKIMDDERSAFDQELTRLKTSRLENEKSSLASRVECTICYLSYDNEARVPRVMKCGHTICHTCVDRIIEQSFGSPKCPFDRKIMFGLFTTDNPYNLPPNRHIMG